MREAQRDLEEGTDTQRQHEGTRHHGGEGGDPEITNAY